MAVILYHGFCLVNIALAGLRVRNIRIPPVLELVAATIAGLLLSFVSVALWRLTGDLIADPDICRFQIEALGLPVASWGMFAAYFMLVNPVIEELYWRGVVQERAKAVGIRQDAIVAIPFSLWHVVPIWFVCANTQPMLRARCLEDIHQDNLLDRPAPSAPRTFYYFPHHDIQRMSNTPSPSDTYLVPFLLL